MLNNLNSWTETAIPKLRVRPLKIKKRSISIIGSLWAKGLKKRNADENGRRIRILDSPFECDCSSCDICSEWDEKEKNGKKRTKRRKETPWRHRPETECFQMRRKKEDREHERGITSGRTPTMPARTTQRAVTQSCKSVVSQFVDVRHCAMMWYDTGFCSFAKRRFASNRDILNSRIFAMFLDYFDKVCAGIFLVRLICILL